MNWKLAAPLTILSFVFFLIFEEVFNDKLSIIMRKARQHKKELGSMENMKGPLLLDQNGSSASPIMKYYTFLNFSLGESTLEGKGKKIF
jgi:hypothetical protein